MSEQPNWYTTGFGGIKKEEERLAQAYGPPRFWIKNGTNTSIVFLDDEPACIHEHNPKINGSWKNWFTCLKDSNPDDAACCEIMGFDTRTFVGFFTVVDCSEWKDQKGQMHRFEIKLFPAKLKTLKLLQSKKEGRENRLAGRVYKVGRTDENSAGVGNDFEYDRDADLVKLFEAASYKGKKIADLFRSTKEEDIARLKATFNVATGASGIIPKLVPFNYWEVLKPKSPKDIRDALRGVRIDKDDAKGGDSKSTTGTTDGAAKSDDDVPF